jgi:hypothetical protein
MTIGGELVTIAVAITVSLADRVAGTNATEAALRPGTSAPATLSIP